MRKKFLIIDGYNVLHAGGLVRSVSAPGSLERARNALIGILHQQLAKPDQVNTILVFDSQMKDLPARSSSSGVQVEFAIGYETADDRIIELIRKHSAPRQLLVVSSDHQIQRVARSRRASTIDSESWMDQLGDSRNQAGTGTSRASSDDFRELPVDVPYWMDQLKLDPDDAGKSRSADDSGVFPPGFGDDLPDE